MAASPFPISTDFSEMKLWVLSLTECCIQTWNILMFSLSQDFYFASPAHPIQQTQCTWLNPLMMVWYCGWCCDGGGPCQPCDFVSVGCWCVGLTKSPACVWQGDFRDLILCVAQLSMRRLPLLVMVLCFPICFHPAWPFLLSPCTTSPATKET